MLGYKMMGSTRFNFSMTDELRSMLAENDILFLFEGGFPDASLI